MHIAEIIHRLPDGIDLKYEDAFSPFTLYEVRDRQDCYILIPKKSQNCLKGIIIVATTAGIRICRQNGWPRKFIFNILQTRDCKTGDKFININYSDIPTDMQGLIVSELIKHIQYKSIES